MAGRAGSIEPTKWTWESDPERAGHRRKKPMRGTKWRARYRDINNRSRSKTFDRLEDARQFLANVVTDMHRGEWIAPEVQRRVFEAFGAGWADELDVRPTTDKAYRSIYKNHVLPYFKGYRMATIDRQTMKKFVSAMRKKGLAPKTVRNIVLVASLVFNVAVDAGVMKANPALKLKLPKKTRKPPRFLTPGEVATLAAATRDGFSFVVYFLAYTGVRAGELCGLRVQNLSLDIKVVRVVHTRTNVSGHTVEGTTKTDKFRSVPLPDFLVEMAREWLAQREAQLGRPLRSDDYVFCNVKGGPMDPKALKTWIIDPAAKTAGLWPLRTHDLRHTYASILISLGAHPKVVQERMGHSTITTTLDVYGHLFPGLDKDLQAKLDALHDRTVPDESTTPAFTLIEGELNEDELDDELGDEDYGAEGAQ